MGRRGAERRGRAIHAAVEHSAFCRHNAVSLLGCHTIARPLLSDTGGGGIWPPPGFWLTHPPTHIRKLFLRKKIKFIKGVRTRRSILGTQTCFWPLTPPPPKYSINQPLSKGLTIARRHGARPVGMPQCSEQ